MDAPAPRIALIHATALAVEPVNAAFERLWPADRPLKLGLLATFQASIASMAQELEAMAAARKIAIELRSVFVPEAMHDLAQGRAADHHRKIAAAARELSDCDGVMLAQFSMAAA